MKYSTKSAQYYNYFEDAKILEIDNENKKLAVVLNGKDDIINIFDASPYINYNHFKKITKEEQIQNEINKKKKGIVQIEEHRNNLDVNQIFAEIKNYKNNISQNSNQNNSNKYLSSGVNSNQQLLSIPNFSVFDNYTIQRSRREASTFSRMLSEINKENKEHQLEKENNRGKKRRYELLFVSKFNIYYNSPSNFVEKSIISIKKPKIKHRLLSVIQLSNDSVLGIKWFSLNNITDIKLLRNLSEKDKYYIRSKMILVISQEGCVTVYKMVDYDCYQIIRVNLNINALQSQPFLNFKEQYCNVASVKLTNPILDFNLLNQTLNDDNNNYVRLVTLHINNSFTFWYIINKNDKLELRIQFNFSLTDFICENFLIDSREEYLICFNKTGLNIYLAKGQNFPYPIVYRYTFNDILPPLDELRKIIYNNDIINDDKEELDKNKEKNKINNDKKEEANKKKQNKRNKKNKESDDINMDEDKDEKKEAKKKKEKKQKKKKKEKEDKPKKDDKENKYPKNKKEKKKKKEKELINEDKSVEIYDELIKFNLKSYNEEEEEMDEEEDEIYEDDDFEVEGNPDFIDKDIDIFFDDDKYLKFLQKPVFLSSETKFLFVNYEVKSNQYSLYCFNFIGLFQIEENKDFLEKCLNKFDPNLITKIYTSKEKIYFYESPNYYFNPVNFSSIDNNLLITINGRKKLREQKFELTTILDNSYHGLFIRDGDYIMVIKISINEAPDLELINHDINSTKFIFYEQPTSENLKSNRFAIWACNNTLLINSVDCLFQMIKFRNESDVLGIAISKKKLVEYINKFYYS